jgi:hypothetical protein
MVQYSHCKLRQKGCLTGTIAVQVPAKEDLFRALQMHANGFLLNFGASILSVNDNFCKKTGREVAEKKMKPTVCDLNSVEVRRYGLKHRYIYHLEVRVPHPKNRKKKIAVYFGLSSSHLTDDVRLAYVEYV